MTTRRWERCRHGEGQHEVCPSQTTTYNLRVIHQDDSKEVRKLVVAVRPGSVIQHVSADRGEVRSGSWRTRLSGLPLKIMRGTQPTGESVVNLPPWHQQAREIASIFGQIELDKYNNGRYNEGRPGAH